jgi:hypothetical protein
MKDVVEEKKQETDDRAEGSGKAERSLEQSGKVSKANDGNDFETFPD